MRIEALKFRQEVMVVTGENQVPALPAILQLVRSSSQVSLSSSPKVSRTASASPIVNK